MLKSTMADNRILQPSAWNNGCIRLAAGEILMPFLFSIQMSGANASSLNEMKLLHIVEL